MSLIDCPRCGDPLGMLIAQDGADDEAEVMDVFCDGCGFEAVDPDLGDAVVEP